MLFFNPIKIATVVAALVAVQVSAQLPFCRHLTVRKEIHQVSSSEWRMIKTVLRYLNDDGYFARNTQIHTSYFDYVHGGPIFFPFHRQIVRDLEMAGQRYDSRFFVPYWDAARECRSPHTSIVFSSQYLGGDGDPSNNNELYDGFQSRWVMSYPNRHRIRRVFNGRGGTMDGWDCPEVVSSLIQSSRYYDEFRENIEYSIHGAVHLGFGGEMTEQFSSNDFGFYMHHANMDRYWWQWQNIREDNVMQYYGNNPLKSRGASLNDYIDGYSERIGDVMKLGTGDMCFIYPGVGVLDSLARENPILAPYRKWRSRSATTEGNVAAKNGTLLNKDMEASTRLKMLSSDTLKKFYPAMEEQSNDPNLYDFGSFTPYDKDTTDSNLVKRDYSVVKSEKYYMPVPRFPPEHYIKMHKYPRASVERVVNQTIYLVNTLNTEGYISPY